MAKNGERVLLVLLAAYLAAAAGRNVAGFPGLHGDEAWLGLYAHTIKGMGIFSPHEMNTYTGPLYGWIIAQVFRFFPADILALRLPGLLCNLLAAFLMAWHLARTCGRRTALAWLALLCGSAAFVLKSRVAWEVYALQGLILTAVIILARRFLAKEEHPFWAVPAFLSANFCGVLNHFMFLSVPLSLFVAALADALFLRERRRRPFLQLTALNLLMAAAVYLLKPALSEALWQRHGWLLGPAALAWPLLCAALLRPLAALTEAPLERLYAGAELRRPRRALLAAGALGLGLFVFYHWIALMQIWSGVAVFQRLSSWTPPWPVVLALYACAAGLLGTFFVFALRRLPPAAAPDWPAQDRFLVHWPLVYAATFILMRNTSSIRYYIIPSYLLTLALAYILPRLPTPRRFLIPLIAAGLFLNVAFWRETAGPSVRRPIRFYIGWHLEKSIDFTDNSAPAEAAREEGVCSFPLSNSFTDLPLVFLASQGSYPCSPDRGMITEFCWECARPPFLRWRIVPLGK